MENRLNVYIVSYLRRRSFIASADAFAQETQVNQENNQEEVPNVLQTWWAAFANEYLPIPGNIPQEQVPVIFSPDGGDLVLAPLRTNRLNRYILQYMRENNFHQAASVFSSEAQVAENLGDCNGLLSRFWIPLCVRTREASTSNQAQNQPPLSVGYTNVQRDTLVREASTSNQAQNEPPLSVGYTNVQHDTLVREANMPSTSNQAQNQPPLSVGYTNVQHDTSVLDDSDFKFQAFLTVFQDLTIKIHSCHFSSDGKLLVYAGARGLVSIYNIDARSHLATTTELPGIIYDVRFKPKSSIFAASCSDGVIRCWDAAANVSELHRELRGHSFSVMTLDFLPRYPDILCSADINGGVYLWNVKQGLNIHTFTVGAGIKQLRFHPHDSLLAVASGKSIMVFLIQIDQDEVIQKDTLEGHDKNIRSICWDASGRFLASVCNLDARVWSSQNNSWICGYNLDSEGFVFESCEFHATVPHLLIGSYMHVHIWDFLRGSKFRVFQMPTSGFISSLAYSSESGIIASTSRASEVKLWKTT